MARRRANKPRGKDKPTKEIAKGAEAIIRSMIERTASGDEEGLALLHEMQKLINEGLDVAVLGLREKGYTNVQIAEWLGIKPQAVSKRWPGGGQYRGVYGHQEQRRNGKDAGT
jgi:hypothetical protein